MEHYSDNVRTDCLELAGGWGGGECCGECCGECEGRADTNIRVPDRRQVAGQKSDKGN